MPPMNQMQMNQMHAMKAMSNMGMMPHMNPPHPSLHGGPPYLPPPPSRTPKPQNYNPNTPNPYGSPESNPGTPVQMPPPSNSRRMSWNPSTPLNASDKDIRVLPMDTRFEYPDPIGNNILDPSFFG
jgi:hypothetical protein